VILLLSSQQVLYPSTCSYKKLDRSTYFLLCQRYCYAIVYTIYSLPTNICLYSRLLRSLRTSNSRANQSFWQAEPIDTAVYLILPLNYGSATLRATPRGLLGRLTALSLLRAKEKERRCSIVYRYKRRKTLDLYTKKRPYSVKPSITTAARSRVPVPELGLLLGMGAGEVHGGCKPAA